MPRGLKDYTEDNISSIPEEKLFGTILLGKSNTIVEGKSFLHVFLNGFKEMIDQDPDINNLQIISFRKIRQYEIVQMIQFAAWKFRNQVKL